MKAGPYSRSATRAIEIGAARAVTQGRAAAPAMGAGTPLRLADNGTSGPGLELAFTGHARELREAEQARHRNAAADGDPVRPDPPPPPKRPLAMAAARWERRVATHQRVWDLYRQGWPGEEIARHLGIGRTTTYL